MKKFVFVFVLGLSLSLASLAYAATYVFFHNGDSVTVQNAAGVVQFDVCSISDKSAFDYTCNGNTQLQEINRDSSAEWTSYECPVSGNYSTVSIVVKEKGKQGKSGTVGPANTDLVVKVKSGTETSSNGKDTKSSTDKNKCK